MPSWMGKGSFATFSSANGADDVARDVVLLFLAFPSVSNIISLAVSDHPPSRVKTLREPQAHLDVVDQNIDLASRHVDAGCVDVEVVLHAFKDKARRRKRPN